MTPASELQVKRAEHLARKILTEESHFNEDWVNHHDWCVVPVSDGNHFTELDITILVNALTKAGYRECLAFATESLPPQFSVCYRVAITADDFGEFNRECGLFRYLLIDQQRNWAISCSETYNLFAGPEALVEEMLGKSIADARQEFLQFASALCDRPDEPLMQVAHRYAAL